MEQIIFKHEWEAKEWFRQYKSFDTTSWDHDKDGYWLGYTNKPVFGDWILFRHIDGDKKAISRPILAICGGHTVWDQALVLLYIENERAYKYNTKLKVSVNRDGVFSHNNNLCHYDQKMESIEFWTDDIFMMGHWKQKPTISELRHSIKKQHNKFGI